MEEEFDEDAFAMDETSDEDELILGMIENGMLDLFLQNMGDWGNDVHRRKSKTLRSSGNCFFLVSLRFPVVLENSEGNVLLVESILGRPPKLRVSTTSRLVLILRHVQPTFWFKE